MLLVITMKLRLFFVVMATRRFCGNSVSRFDVSHFNASNDVFILSDFHYNSSEDTLWANKCILTPNSAGTILSVSKSGYQQINTSSYSSWNNNQISFVIHKIVGIKRG